MNAANTDTDKEEATRCRMSLFRLFVHVCGVLSLIGPPHAASADTAQTIAKQAFGSTVLIVMEDANGQPLSLGSGFFVRDGEIASNLHVVEGAVRGYAKSVGYKTKHNIEGITRVDVERDLVVLEVSGAKAVPLSLGDSDAVEVGETVYAIGNPRGLEGTLSQGIVSGIRNVGSDKLLQITAPISPGSSGGPVLNSSGEVIGISVATFRGGQNLNFAIPSNYLKALLAMPKTLEPLATATPQEKHRSIVTDLGGKSTEGVAGSSFIWDYALQESGRVYPVLHGRYTFSLRNKLREDVEDVYALVVFYDKNNSPLDVDVIEYRGVILAGLARRVSGKVDGSVQRLTAQDGGVPRIELRILDFRIVQ